MKGKLFLLLGIGFVPLALTGQTYLYNKGTMSVVTTNNQNTALYIGGDLRSEASPTKGTGSILLTKAKIVLTGNLYNYGELDGTGTTQGHVFNVNDYTGYGTAANRSSLHFKGTSHQNVWQASAAGGVDFNKMNFKLKSNSVIYFPDIVIENDKHVTINPEVGASAYNITPVKGRLILDSRKLNLAGGDKLPGGSTIHNDNSSSVLAHLLVRGTHSQEFATSEGQARALDGYPGVQVNLALNELPTSENQRYHGDPIVGMGSPFKKIRADYFMWNFLFLPSGNNIFNEDGNTTTDPTTVLDAGRGFVVGIDLRGQNGAVYNDIHPFYRDPANGYALNFATRSKNGYKFNRFAYGNNRNNLYQVKQAYTTSNAVDKPSNNDGVNVKPSDPSNDAYIAEVLNSGNVSRTLVKGFNYLSNPFTCPLDVSRLVFINTAATPSEDSEWKVAPGFTPATGSATTPVGEIANRVWVMDPASVASGTYDVWSGGQVNNPGNKWVVAHYKYRLISHIGATGVADYDDGSGDVPDGANSKALIAPMQMFVVYANTGGVGKNIVIPASQRKIDDNALFLRSEGVKKYESDDFLLQVEDLDKGTMDRAAVVLRTFSEINKSGYQNIAKLTTDVSSNEDGKTRAVTSEGTTPKTSGMSSLYTQDSDGNALETRFLSIDLNSSTTSTTLYLKPSLTEHQITIRSFRNYTKDRISEIWLDDNKTGKKTKLSEGATYTTTSSPKDNADRFTLRFIYPAGGIGDEGIVNPDDTSITAHYANNTLTVSGFNDSDYGSLVSVYDIQGRLLKQQKVDGTTVKFNDGFAVGAYIVKVTGNRSYATKFLAR
ncbi:T9SS type A sorting domain-containing protein [Dysgonomonas capnocytophagoides]|uniref:T9SS type A sorting domain-containing protein n=1 Tax=Dysgonomonas capnocytophagoides TaxID=45254 RepID=UPI002922B8BE|nr:hypothetical protein DCPSUM001_20810 [Dysgonomonas capnocytophagoides]